jgi:hypothetical protein
MTTSISKKSWLGVAVESPSYTAKTAPGTPGYIPTKSIVKGGWKPEYLDEERGDRNANYGVVLTTREGDGDPKGPYYNDTSPYWLLGFMGTDNVTQPDATHVPTVYKHTFAFADEPPTLTVFKSYDAAVYYMTGTVVEKVVLKFSAEAKLLEIEPTLKGFYPVPYTGSPLTPSFSTLTPFPGYMPTIVMTAGASTDINEMTLTMEQKVTAWYGAGGSPDVIRFDFGERKATLEFTARFDNPANIFDRWRLGQTDTCHITFQGALIANSGGSGTPPNTNYYQTLDINIGTISYDSAEHDLSKDNVMIKCKATVIPTAGVLFSCFVQNTIAAYT